VEKRAVSIRELFAYVHGATADFVAFYAAFAVSTCLSNAIKSAGRINGYLSGTQSASQRRKAFTPLVLARIARTGHESSRSVSSPREKSASRVVGSDFLSREAASSRRAKIPEFATLGESSIAKEIYESRHDEKGTTR